LSENHAAEREVDGEPVLADPAQRPDTLQPVLFPVVVLFVLTVVAQLISLAFGRSNEEQSFSCSWLPGLTCTSARSLA
jgi:hypothetical protein